MMNLILNNFYFMGMVYDLFMFLILIFSSVYFNFHPLMLSLMLMFYTLILSLKINFLGGSYWYSYILFLIMVGGVMILILYLTAISNNELFIYSFEFIINFLIKFFFLCLVMMYLCFYLFDVSLDFNMLEIFNQLNGLMLMYIKNLYININLSVYMLFYLFMLMVLSVLICSKNLIPLRQMVN